MANQVRCGMALPIVASGKKVGLLAVVLCATLVFSALACASDAPPVVDGVDTLANDTEPPGTGAAGLEPCTVRVGGGESLCSQRDVSSFAVTPSETGVNASNVVGNTDSVEDILESGFLRAGDSPVHIVFRGTPTQDSIRCAWRGTARTLDQREQALDFWLGLGDVDSEPTSHELRVIFGATLDVLMPRFGASVRAAFMSIVMGGESHDIVNISCYADYNAGEYILGSGPTKATVAYDRLGEAPSYDLYQVEHEAGMFGSEPLSSEGQHYGQLNEMLREAEEALREMIGGRESVVMLAPMGAHDAIAVEAWQAVELWDLQEDDQGVVQAVRYGVPAGDPEHTQTLANLKTRVTAAAASGRIRGAADRERERARAVLPGHGGVRGHHAGGRVDGDLHPGAAAAGVLVLLGDGGDEPGRESGAGARLREPVRREGCASGGRGR